jgi:hypothetical protein
MIKIIKKAGLVRFMDNWPWATTDHGQNNFFLDCPYFMNIVHILVLVQYGQGQGQFFQKIVHDTWTIYNFNYYIKLNYKTFLKFTFLLLKKVK